MFKGLRSKAATECGELQLTEGERGRAGEPWQALHGEITFPQCLERSRLPGRNEATQSSGKWSWPFSPTGPCSSEQQQLERTNSGWFYLGPLGKIDNDNEKSRFLSRFSVALIYVWQLCFPSSRL